MSLRSLASVLILSASLALVSGCHNYQVEVEIRDDGAGSRTTTFETEHDLSPADQRLLGLDGAGWDRTTVLGHEGGETWRYRREQEIDGLDGWPRSGGTLLRGTDDGEIRLVTSVAVEEIRGAGRHKLVYRETVFWIGLQEKVAGVVARDYGAFLRREFPDLPDSLVHEARGSMATTIIQNWAEIAGVGVESGGGSGPEPGNDLEYEGAAEGSDPEAVLGARFNLMFMRRLRQAGVAPELAQAVARATADWDYFEGVDAAVPGLDHSLSSTYRLTVHMPSPVTGGTADTVEGKVASFRIDLTDVLPAPVTVEAICDR